MLSSSGADTVSTGRGVLAMANSGPHSNGSQFYILYKSAHHLDHKHTVFGKVVGGLGTLTALERLPVDDEDRPLQVPPARPSRLMSLRGGRTPVSELIAEGLIAPVAAFSTPLAGHQPLLERSGDVCHALVLAQLIMQLILKRIGDVPEAYH